MAKYLDPKADLTFKKIFGEHPDLVMSLLNALLPLEKGKEICDIHYLSPERVPRTEEGKDSIVDVYCETNDKRQFIVEMQMYWSTNFMQRVLFNSSKVYVSQLKQGASYENLQPVYSLNLIDDIFEPNMEEFYHYYRLVHDKDTKKVIDGFHLVFVELKKFNPKTMAEKKEGTREINNFMGRRLQVLWLRFLTEINAYTEEVPQELLDNPEISKAISLVEESAYNREQLLGYDMFWDRVSRDRTLANDLKRTKEQLAQVEAQAKQKLLQTARNLKAMNVMTTEQIAEATGLTVEEIDTL
jgi:predicted transposase/invertase (TIGR01784 family)